MRARSLSSRGGFTLVELMIVMGIIAVLITILIPTVQKARRSARATMCLSNLRQCYSGFQQYALDWDGTIVLGRTRQGNIQGWAHYLINGNDIYDRPTGQNYVPRRASLCPESTGYIDYDQALTTAQETNLAGEGGTRSFGIFFADASTDKLKKIQRIYVLAYSGTNWDWWINFQQITNLPVSASDLIMLADSTRGGDPGYGRPQMCAFRDQVHEGPYYAGRINTIHGNGPGRANVIFYDGHTDSLDAKGLSTRTATQIKRIYDRNYQPVSLP